MTAILVARRDQRIVIGGRACLAADGYSALICEPAAITARLCCPDSPRVVEQSAMPASRVPVS
jgi:hypothetical protein